MPPIPSRTRKKQVRTIASRVNGAGHPANSRSDDASEARIRDEAVARLHLDANVEEPDREIPWGRISADRTRVVVGTTDGRRAVFGVYALGKDGEVGEAEPFNFAKFELTWHGKKEHPTKAQTEADEAELLAWLEKNR
jgi:hypothetical protein